MRALDILIRTQKFRCPSLLPTTDWDPVGHTKKLNKQSYKKQFIYFPTAITAPLLAWATTQIWIPIIPKLNVCTTVE